MLVALSMAASPLADLAGSAAAMACCAKTDYSCAGMRGPDDCCRQMGQAGHGVPAGTLSNSQPSFLTSVVPTFDAAAMFASAPLGSVSSFTRPHDPPHLHSYSLLI